jgi:hypothetical protein
MQPLYIRRVLIILPYYFLPHYLYKNKKKKNRPLLIGIVAVYGGENEAGLEIET